MEKDQRIVIAGETHINTKAHVAMNLLVASMITAVGFYLFYIRYRLQTFHPVADSSLVIPLHIPELRPEIEVPLYFAGVLFVPLGGIILFHIFQKLMSRFTSSIQSVSSATFWRVALLVTIAVYASFLSMSNTWQESALVFLPVATMVFFAFFIVPHRLSKILLHVQMLLDWTVALALFLVTSLFLSRYLFDHAFRTDLVNLATSYGYVHIATLPVYQAVIVMVLAGVMGIAWMNTKKVFRKKIAIPGYVYDALILVGIIFGVSIVAMNGWGSPYLVIPNYNGVMGPVNDVLRGKTLLVNIHSQYGLLLIWALSFIFRVVPLTYTYFFWINFIVTAVGYSLIYIILKKWLGWVAVLGLFFIFEHHYYAGIVNILLTSQQTFLRWGGWIILLSFIVFTDTGKIHRRLRVLGEMLLVGIFTFWGFDVGIYTLGAYMSMRIVGILLEKKDMGTRARESINFGLRMLVTLGLFALIISVLVFLQSGFWPDWSRFAQTASQFIGGLYMIPMPTVGPYIILLSLYLGVVTYILSVLFVKRRELSPRKIYDVRVVTFITIYGILQFTHYVGRSTDNSLHTVIIPAILLACWLLRSLKKQYELHGLHNTNIRHTVIFGALVFIVWSATSIMTMIGTVNMYGAYRNRTNLRSVSFDRIEDEPYYRKAIDRVGAYVETGEPSTRRVAIISQWDSFFLIKTKSINVIESNNMDYFTQKSQLKELALQLKTADPERFFADHYHAFEVVPYILDNFDETYHISGNFGYLDEWVKN